LADKTVVRAFEGHTAAVLRGAWISNGTQLVSSGGDGVVKLWRVNDGVCVNTFDAHDARPWAMAVNGDGEQIVTGADDAAVIVWKGLVARVV
jgi:U3 small nucleolar RNA-associated protein 13